MSSSAAAPTGLLFIVSGPSGAGKTMLSGAALRTFPGLVMSVSCTTRAPRPGEADGREYHFVDGRTFERMIAGGELAEWAEVHGNRYGTPKAPIDAALASGHDVLLDIDVQGAAQLRRAQAQFSGAATQQDHAANAIGQQSLQLGIRQFPAGVAALAIAAVAAAAHHHQAGQLAPELRGRGHRRRPGLCPRESRRAPAASAPAG